MSLNNPRPGYSFAPEYQVAATAWLTSSVAVNGTATRYSFPNVTRFITVLNRDPATSSSLSIGFTELGMSTYNKYVLQGNQSVTLELRIKDVWIKGEGYSPPFSMCAGLTNIDRSMMPTLTGSLWQGVG